jgi:hypothetical protein
MLASTPIARGTTRNGLIKGGATRSSPRNAASHSDRLPRIPDKVDPDAWLAHYHKRCYRRHVDSRGSIQLWKSTYYVGRAYANQTALVRLDAQQRSIQVEVGQTPVKSLPLKGLSGQLLDYPDFLGLMCDEARSEWRTYLWHQRLKSAPKAS